MSERELCHSTSKSIGNEKDTQIFYGIQHRTMRAVFRVIVGSQIMVSQQSLPYNDTLVIRTHDLSSDTICRIVNYTIIPQNQLVINE